MFISKKKLKNIIDRLEALEKNQTVNSYKFGKIGLKEVVKIIERGDKNEKRN